MRRSAWLLLLVALRVPLIAQVNAEATVATNDSGSVPVTVRFTENASDFGVDLLPGPHGMTFSIYKNQTGGTPLWMETQSVNVDDQGRFNAVLGKTTNVGLPPSIFSSIEPQWIGITFDSGAEPPRVQFASVPYAFQSANADTLGGQSPQEFVTQQQLRQFFEYYWPHPVPFPPPPIPVPVISRNAAPNFEATSPSGPSFISDANNGPPLSVKSEELVPHLNVDLLHGLSDQAFAKLTASNSFAAPQVLTGGAVLPPSSPELNSTNIFDSAPLDFQSSSPGNQGGSTASQLFRWQSQPLFNSGGPSAHLSLLFGLNGAPPTPTGLSFNSDGTINFASNQTLPTAAVVGALGGGFGDGAGQPSAAGTPFVNTSAFQWVENPPTNSITLGVNIVTLKPCPRGINGTDAWHYLYISGTGTPEVVLLTGGTCTSGAPGGTIEFTADYNHPRGYSIGSSSDGIQEAIIQAEISSSQNNTSRQVMVSPGIHLLRARVSVRSSAITISSSGATLECAMKDTCLMLGDPNNSNQFNGIVVQGLRLAPAVQGGTWTAIEDNAQGSNINDFAPGVSAAAGSFGSLVKVDNDQNATINNISVLTNFAWGICNTTFCSTAIVGPGPYSTNAGVITVNTPNLSMQCGGNGIDNQDGNTLKVVGGVIQGFAQFGIRASTVYQPNTVDLNGVYFEEDGNCNPLGTGSAGLIAEGGTASAYGGQPTGFLPEFANTGSVGYYYYVVVHSSTLGTSSSYLAGLAQTNQTGPINVLWNKVGSDGVITYDVLRVTGDGGADMAAPSGTGSFAVATGVPASVCSNTCLVVDNAATTPAAYSVADNTPYWPSLKLWPGNVVLTNANDAVNNGGGNPTTYVTDQIVRGGAGFVNSAGATYPSVFAQTCNPMSNWSPILMQCMGGNSVGNDWPAVVGTLFQLSGTGGAAGGLKGRVNFYLPPGAEVGPTHVITLSDSNVDKTLATPGNRPTWDPNDMYLGYDGGYVPSKMQMSIGAPVAISRYIGNTGDNVNYSERLTATQEQYRVPVSFYSVSFDQLANLLPTLPDGTTVYCLDCLNVGTDGASFDSAAAGGGHGTSVLHEDGQWRVH